MVFYSAHTSVAAGSSLTASCVFDFSSELLRLSSELGIELKLAAPIAISSCVALCIVDTALENLVLSFADFTSEHDDLSVHESTSFGSSRLAPNAIAIVRRSLVSLRSSFASSVALLLLGSLEPLDLKSDTLRRP